MAMLNNQRVHGLYFGVYCMKSLSQHFRQQFEFNTFFWLSSCILNVSAPSKSVWVREVNQILMVDHHFSPLRWWLRLIMATGSMETVLEVTQRLSSAEVL